VLAASLALSGCVTVSSHMAPSKQTEYAPAPNKALVIFFRPSRFGGLLQSSVFDSSQAGSEPSLVGVVSATTKVAYQAAPGDHTFMVIGESADFAAAHLVAGKTYYVLVEPRIGAFRARYTLEPIHKAEGKYSFQSPDFQEWQSGTTFVELAPSALEWFKENKTDIVAKRDEYLPKWLKKDEGDRTQHTIAADDGM
jgi:hypothetical protein